MNTGRMKSEKQIGMKNNSYGGLKNGSDKFAQAGGASLTPSQV